MFCGKCGIENPDDTKYCLNCGADLEKMRTPPPGGRKSTGDRPTAGGKISTTDFRQSIGQMKTILSDEDIALLFDKGALISDRYEIKALLGKGGMGVVYQVHDRLLREEAALKMMLPSLMMQKRAVERFIQEARISLHLSHENIVRVRDIGEFQSLRYISMEYVKGVTLRQLIEEKRGKGEVFSLEECWKILMQIVEALLYAHKRTVHRDIKPENIMLTPEGVVKIMDFGIAKAMDLSKFISTSSSLGTAYYMAPEQTKASAEVDHRADIFSVGVILYEMLTGDIPIGKFKSPHSINPQIPEEIDTIIERALNPLPEERYQSISELKEELEEIGRAYLVSEGQEPLKYRELTKPPVIDTNFIRCIYCHINNPQNRRFCYHCGANLKIACPKCGKEIRVDLTYCGECGANILEAKERKVGELEAKAKGYIEEEDYQKAKKETEAIAKLDRKHPLISQLREGIEKKKERVRKTEELVQKASALLKDKKYQEAVDTAKNILKLDRGRVQRIIVYLLRIASTLTQNKKYQEAVDAAKRVLELDKANQKAQHIIDEALYKSGKIIWPMFRRDSKHSGRSNYKGPVHPRLKWTFTTGDKVISSPAIGMDGTIYVGSNDHNLYAINPYGSKKWKFVTRDKVKSSPAIGSDGTIYVGSMDEKLYAVNPNGRKKWSVNIEHSVNSSPALGPEDTIYIGSWRLYAINPKGRKKWSSTNIWFISSSPAIGSDGTIYVGSNDKKFYAINPNGILKWKYRTRNKIIGASASVGSDGTIYVGSDDKKLYAINSNGSLKWKYKTKGAIVSSPAIGADGIIYVGSRDKKLYAINPDGSKKWEFATGGWIDSSPAIGSDGTIYVGSSDGKLYAINPDGSKKWAFATGRGIESSPAIGADGTIYIGSYDCKLYAIGEK